MPELDRPFIVGECVYLRPLEVEDVTDKYLQWMNDESIARYIPTMSLPGTRKAVMDYVESQVNNSDVMFFAIIEKSTGNHVGNIKLGPVNWRDRRAEYGRIIGEAEARSNGYGSEAVRLLLQYAFNTLNLRKIYANCIQNNAAAIRSNEKNGLAVETILKEYIYVQGVYEDVVMMSITQDHWRSLLKKTGER